MVVPCMVNSWLYVSALTSRPFGCASCARMNSASMPPIRKNASAVQKYSKPIRL